MNRGIQNHRYCKVNSDTGIQGHRDTRIQGFMDIGIQKYRDIARDT